MFNFLALAWLELAKLALGLLGLVQAQLSLSPLDLVCLDRLTSWNALGFEQKNPWNLSKTAPNPARIEVEHDFFKTRLPRVILKLVCQPSNFTRFLNP